MKKNIKSFLIAAAALFAFSACTEVPAVDELGGLYPAPENYEMNNLLFEERVQGEKVHNFNLLVATEGVTLDGENLSGTGAALSLNFLCNKSTLTPQSYSPAEAASGKNGNYVIGEGGSELIVVENGTATPKAIKSGSVIVTIFQEKYNLYGTLVMADNSNVKFDSTVDIPDHGELLVATKLTQVLSAANNNGILTIKVATEDVTYTYDAATWSEIYGGEGNYLALDIYTPDGFLYEGTYTPSAEGGVIGVGEYSIGYDTTMDFGWGPMEFFNWGTCWWTVENGVTSAQKILEGDIVVTKSGSKYTIEYLHGGIWFKFSGAIEAVDPDAGSGSGDIDTTDYVELTQLLSATSNVANGTNSLSINMATEGVTATVEGWSTIYSGDGNYLALDIYSEDGKLYTGTYNVNTTAGTIEEGQFGMGWDPGDLWGIGIVFENWGTCWWTVADGATSAEKVLDGEVEVLVEGENLVIKLRSTTVNAKFTYPIADFKDGQGNAIEVVNNTPAVDTTEYEELTQLMSATSNVANGTKSLTINMANESLAWEFNTATYSNVFTADGSYLAMDIYSEDGKLYTGTYNVNTTAGTIEEGQFGMGWDPGDLWGIGMVFENWGTCWWTVADGATSAEKVLDGEMDILVEGENLVIKLRSTTVNAKFTYPIADFKDGQGNAIEVVAE